MSIPRQRRDMPSLPGKVAPCSIHVATSISSTLCDSRTSTERTSLNWPIGGTGLSEVPSKKLHLRWYWKAAKARNQPPPFGAVKWAVPPRCLAHAGHLLHDERVGTSGDDCLLWLHSGDVGLNVGIPIGLGQQRRFARLPGHAFPCARSVGHWIRSPASQSATLRGRISTMCRLDHRLRLRYCRRFRSGRVSTS